MARDRGKSSPKIAEGTYRDRGKSSPKIAEGAKTDVGNHLIVESTGMRSDEKKCPYCDEIIKKAAKKCRWCMEWLTASGRKE